MNRVARDPVRAHQDCTYNGFQRSEWGYDGTQPCAYVVWANCNLSTGGFDSVTPDGDGTQALVHPDDTECSADADCGSGMMCEMGFCVSDSSTPGDNGGGSSTLVILLLIGLIAAVYVTR